MAIKTKTKKQAPKRREEVIMLGVDMIQTENPRNVYGLYQNEYANPTPEQVKFDLEGLRRGLCYFAALRFEHMRRRDLHLKAVCQTRKLPISSKEWIIEFKAAGKNEDIKNEAADFIKNQFSAPWFIQFITDCVEANISGLSIFEINFGIEGDKVVIESVKLIPNHLILYSDKEDKYYFLTNAENDIFKMRNINYSVTSEDSIDLSKLQKIDIPEIKKLEVHSLDGSAGNGMLNGFVDGLMFAYLKRNYASKDWAIFLEKFANPPVSASYDPMLIDSSKSKAKEAVQNFGVAKWSVYPNGISFKVHDDTQKAQTSILFKDYVTEIKEEISIAILGQTLTTSVGDRGTQALGKVHEQVREDLQQADMIVVSSAVNELVKRLVEVNFPGISEDLFPVFKFVSQVDIAFKKDLAVAIRDLRVAGLKVSPEEVSKKFDLKLEETTAVGAAVDENQNNNDNGNPPEPKPKDKKKKEEDDEEDDAEKMKMLAKKINKKETEKQVSELIEKIYNENKN